MAHQGFSCFCLNQHSLPSFGKKVINFSLLQTVVDQTLKDGRKYRLKQKQLKPWWAIMNNLAQSWLTTAHVLTSSTP